VGTSGIVARRWEHPSERSFWQSLVEAEREACSRLAGEQVFRSGAVLCREGEASTHVIIVRSGWIKVAVHLDGREQIVTVRGTGDVVGERAALTRRSRSATVTALGDVAGLVVPAGEFRALLEEHPRILEVLERQDRERLVEDDEHLFRRDATAVEYRLAYLLRELAFRRGERTPAGTTTLTLPISRVEVAHWVDADAPEVDRALDGWRRSGVVRTARRSLTVVDAGRLEEPSRRRPETAPWSSLNCSIFFTDVVGFSAACRNEGDRQEVRDALYEILRQAFEESGVSWTECYHEDRGDGVLTVIPPTIPTRAVADPLLALLTAGLRRHNRRSSAAVRIQLRAALHVGPVYRDREGLNGDAIIHTARMLDAPLLREAMKTSDADLAFMSSDHVFQTVIRQGPGLVDPETFQRVDFRLKESQIAAWMHLSGTPVHKMPSAAETVPPAPDARPAAQATGVERGAMSAPAPPARQVTGFFFNDAVWVGGDLVHGDKIINSP
jgi:CRP-like cAMP-binding protein